MFRFRHDGSGELAYATRESAGFDLTAREGGTVAPGAWRLFGTGLHIVERQEPQKIAGPGEEPMLVLPELQIRSRSGLASRSGIVVLNSPSTIDADYRGEIFVCLHNLGPEPFEVCPGDRIAQAVCALVAQVPGIPLRDVSRGTAGFGSTGVRGPPLEV